MRWQGTFEVEEVSHKIFEYHAEGTGFIRYRLVEGMMVVPLRKKIGVLNFSYDSQFKTYFCADLNISVSVYFETSRIEHSCYSSVRLSIF